MGEKIIRKVKGMSWTARISLMLVFTLLASIFMYQGWYKPIKAMAATAGPNAPVTAIDDATVGSAAWLTPGNVTASDNSYASINNLGTSEVTHYIKATNFGFSIPAGSTINGIVVSIDRYDSGTTASLIDSEVKLVKAGVIQATNKASGTTWPGAEATATYGAINDLWGGTWNDTDINNTGFGVVLSAKDTGTTNKPDPKVDYITITITYTPPVTTTVGDGTSPADKFAGPSATNKAVSAFTLSTSSGTDPVTQIVVTGTNTANVAASGVKIYQDNGSTPNEWDATDTLITNGTASFAGATATFSSLSINVTTTSTQYIITYNIVAAPTNGQTLTGVVTSVTCTNSVTNNDTTDATITIDAAAPTTTDNTPAAWQASEITVTLTPDDGTGSGVTAATGIYGCFGTACTPAVLGGTTMTTACGAGTECTYDVRYYSKDNVGNTESTKTAANQAKVDQKAPAYSWNTPAPSTTYKDGGAISVDVLITEAGSGITNGATCNPKIDGATTSFTGTVTYSTGTQKCTGTLTLNTPSGLADGAHNLTVQVADNVANSVQSAARSINTDNAKPSVTSTVPADLATGVALNSNVTINWSENVNCATVNTTNITSTSPGWTFSSCSGSQALFTTSGQSNSTTYNVNVTTNVTDSVGNPMAAAYPFSYTTVAAACTVNAPLVEILESPKTITTDNGNVTYNVRITNQDSGAACTNPLTINLSRGDSNGNFTSSIPTPVSLAPGANTTVVLTVTEVIATSGETTTTTVTASAAAHSDGTNTILTTYNTSNPLLHNSVNLSSDKWLGNGGWGIGGAKYGEFTCGTCHAPRATNIKGIKSSITTPDTSKGTLPGDGQPIVFSRTSGALSDSGLMGVDQSPYTPRVSSDRICQVCHTYDATQVSGVNAHPYNSLGNTLTDHMSSDAKDCTDCHKHNTAFSPAGGTCNACHGAPPTAGGLAAHAKHYGIADVPTAYGDVTFRSTATLYGFSCGKCHKDGLHMDGTVDGSTDDISFDDTTDPKNPGATYTFATKTCSNLYCHGNFIGGLTASPTWTGTAACGTCHGINAGVPPGTVASGSKSSHAAHITGSTLNLGCGKCHNTYTNNDTHVNGSADWYLDSADSRIGSGTYKGAASGTNTPPGTVAYGNCSTIYCHSNVQTSPPGSPLTYRTPAWGGGALGCTTTYCHGGNTDPNKITSGTHTEHVTTGTYNYTCSTCHSGKGDNTTFHADYSVDVAMAAGTYGGLAAPGDAYGSCSSVYCHSNANPMAGTNNYINPTWGGTAIADCVSCHSNTGGGGVNLSTRHADHFTNYNYGCIQCHNDTVSDNTTIKASGYALHVNGSKNVAWGTRSTGGSAYASPNCSNIAGTQLIYCHSNGTSNASPPAASAAPNVAAAWGTTFADLCVSCHSGDASMANKMATNKHGAHINDTANAVGKNIGCQECHRPTVSGNTTVATYANHVNKLINVGVDNVLNLNTDNPTYAGSAALSTPGMTKAPGSAVGSCFNFYCHSSGNLGTGSNLTFRTIAWNAAAISCDGCHGNQATKAHPVYATGGAGTVNANSHVKHVETSLIKCDTCHINTTTDVALPPTTVVTGTLHINRVENVTFNTTKAGASAAWTAGTKTCSTTYCHGTAGIVWGGAALTCSSCHSSMGAGTGGAAYVAKHQKHTDNTTTKYIFACENCHDADQTAHAGGLADAVAPQQAAEMKFENTGTAGTWVNKQYGGGGTTFKYTKLNASPYGAAAPTPAYAKGAAGGTDNGFPWTIGSCSSVWCHSIANPMIQGAEAQRNAYRAPTWTGALGCAGCHRTGNVDNYATMSGAATTDRLSTSHAKHLATDKYGTNANFTCNSCHDTVADNNTTINTTTGYGLHVDGSKKVQLNAWAGGTWLSPNCSTSLYCHSTGVRLVLGTTYRTQSWSVAIATCTPCHLGPDNYTNMTTLADRLSTAHAKHKATNSPGHGANTNFTCNTCHSTVVSSGDSPVTDYTLHVNKINNVSLNAWAGGTWSTPNCSNTYCHSKGTGGTLNAGEVRTVLANTSVAWTATTTCGSCHGEGGATGSPSYANLRRSPTAAVGSTWTTPTNVYASDDSRAVYTATRVAVPVINVDYLSITGFGFTAGEVPADATITDITVLIEGNGTSATAAQRQIMVSMVKAGALAGTAKTAQQLNLTTDAEMVLGGNNDLWGTTWTPAQIQAATFGVAITDNDTTGGAGNALNIDRVRIVVHYTGPTTPSPKMNSHAKHTASTCDKCHNSTTTTGSTITDATKHVDKLYSLLQGTGVTFTYAYNVAGGSCSTISCHANAQWGVSEMDCVSCHTGTQGTRRAMVGEFNNTWSHKRTAGKVVTKYDCGVCHMEGSPTTGATTAFHKNGNLEFRDPDTGVTIKGVTFASTPGSYTSTAVDAVAAVFSRNTNLNTLEPFAQAVQVNLCHKCHDTNGANSASARVTGGTATQPFGTSAGTRVDVSIHFATGNSSYHPVMGKQNNSYCNANTMIAPWNFTKTPPNITSWGYLMTCWDCHDSSSTPRTIGGANASVTAHGNAVTLRAAYSRLTAGGSITTFPTPLCVVCHKQTVYAGTVLADSQGKSAFDNTIQDYGHPNAANARMDGADATFLGCQDCHGTGAADPGRPIRAEDAHGFNLLPGGAATWGTTGAKPWGFLRNTQRLEFWGPRGYTNATKGTCNGSLCASKAPHTTGLVVTYDPGGTY